MYGQDNVLTTDIIDAKNLKVEIPTAYEKLNALDNKEYKGLIEDFAPTTILHLPAILSGKVNSKRRDGCRNGNSH